MLPDWGDPELEQQSAGGPNIGLNLSLAVPDVKKFFL